jgi:hypothetical protein
MPATTRQHVEIRTITIGNPIEDTPDGIGLMDRVRDAEAKHRADLEELLTPAGLALLDEAERKFEREVFFGPDA